MTCRNRILVVEDLRHIAYFLTHQLEKAGYEARAHYTGTGVVELVEQWRPAALLLDVGLPGRNGMDICRELRTDARFDSLKIFIVTSHSFDACAQEIGEIGADAHFAKPVSPASLLSKLKELGIEAVVSLPTDPASTPVNP